MFSRLFEKRMTFVLAAFCGLIMLFSAMNSQVAGLASCEVPSDTYTSIQNAVDDPSCDTVNISEGKYDEVIVIERPLTISGQGMEQTIINGDGKGSVITINTTAVTLRDLALEHGSAHSGGGIYNEEARVSIIDCGLFQSYATVKGGGINNHRGSLHLNNVTLSENLGSPALLNDDGDVRILNSILSGNHGNAFSDFRKDCAGTILSEGYNLVSDTSECDFQVAAGDILNISAQLGELTENPSYNPLLMGPGINRGNPDGCKNHLGQVMETDQIGNERAGRCDMGAIEFQGEYHLAFLPFAIDNYCWDYFDDFGNPDSGWPVDENAVVRAGYNAGEYQIYTKSADYVYLFASPACEWDDYFVEVDARWAGVPGLAYGLVFDIKGDFDNYLIFGINTDYQSFWLDYRSPSGWSTIVSPQRTGLINPGQARNHLKVIRDGDQIILEVNGKYLLQYGFRYGYDLGRTGVFSVPYNNRAISDARFDNFASKKLKEDGRSLATGTRLGMGLDERHWKREIIAR